MWAVNISYSHVLFSNRIPFDKKGIVLSPEILSEKNRFFLKLQLISIMHMTDYENTTDDFD